MKKKKKLNLSKVTGGMSINIEGNIEAKKMTLVDNSKQEHTQNDQTFHKVVDTDRNVSIFSSPLS